MTSKTAFCADTSPLRMRATEVSTGISTPYLSASSTTSSAVKTPSAVPPPLLRMDSMGSPCPRRMPTLRLRERSPKQVSKMSPMPESPATVCGLAPIFTASHRISAEPWQMSADMALMPRPRPSQMPAAMARTFFSAPATSTPVTSSVMVTRNWAEVRILCTRAAALRSLEAATTEVGLLSMISVAKEGPETTTTGFSSGVRPRASWMRSHISSCEPSSRPLETDTIGTPMGT
mmetsp:Transcript_77256/g.202698  ORF Transcript_77256/g.202698 Transcript_77256/m.202698 type:complete len:233 (+) Transcript_77256:236-934(+)